MRIAYLSNYSPDNIQVWSGTPYHVFHHLQKYHDVEWIGGGIINGTKWYHRLRGRKDAFRPEYGHYIQSQRWGIFYMPAIAIPSLFSAMGISKVEHDKRWFEVNASKLGAEYFDKHYGRKSSRYKKGKGDYFDINAFRNGGGTPYLNPRIGLFYQDQSYPIYDWGY